MSILTRGALPLGLPYTRSRGDPDPAPCAWLARDARSRLSPSALPLGLPYTRSRGDPDPAPCAWLAPYTRSRLSPSMTTYPRGFALPLGLPLHALSRRPRPRALRVAPSLRSPAP